MRRFAFVLLCVFCLAGAVALTSCESEPEIPADEPITKTVTFTIHNDVDCALTISSIEIDAEIPDVLSFSASGGWDDISQNPITTNDVVNVDKIIEAGEQAVIEFTLNGYRKYRGTSSYYNTWPHYVKIECNYNDGEYPYVGNYTKVDGYWDNNYVYLQYGYKTSEAIYNLAGDSSTDPSDNTLRFVKAKNFEDDGEDYTLAVVY